MSDESSKLPQEVESLIQDINTGGGGGLGREAATAKLQALLASNLGRELHSLTDSLDTGKRILGQRISELNTQIEGARGDLRAGAESANEHSRALVFWTKTSVWLVAAYVLLTACLLWVSHDQFTVAQQALRAQAEPELIMEVVRTMEKGNRIVLKNEGAYPVTDISVDTDLFVFLGPPVNQKLSEMYRSAETVGSPWWEIKVLEAGEIQEKSIEEIGLEALKGQHIHKSFIESGHVRGVSPKDSPQILPVIRFKMVAHRAVDRKRYQKEVSTVVLEDSNTGKPHFVDPRTFSSSFTFLRENRADK